MLDDKRLGNQRNEAKIILDTLRGKTSGWKNHPAVKMWKGHLNALKMYYNAIVAEWIMRGHKNRMPFEIISGKVVMPEWLGRKAFHDAHKSNLLRKNPAWYKQFGWKIPNDLEYVWPE